MDCFKCIVVFINVLVISYVHGEGYDDGGSGLRYGGQFVGNCDGDGMYFNDQNSYVMCSHSIAYIMPCAPGTRNSGRQLETLSFGDSVGFTAFCDVNLVDIGYAAFHSAQNAQSSGYGGSGGNSGYSGGSTKGTSGGYGSSGGYRRQSSGYGTGNSGSKVQIVLSGSYQKPMSTGYAQPKPKQRYTVQSYSQQQPSYGQAMTYGSKQASSKLFVQQQGQGTGYSTGLKNFNRGGGNTYQSYNTGRAYQ